MDCNLDTCPAYIKATKNEEDIKEIKNMKIEGRLASIETTLNQLAKNVNILIEQPSKRWEMVIGALIVGGVTILVEIFMK